VSYNCLNIKNSIETAGSCWTGESLIALPNDAELELGK
jgi:hypothetical protein